LPEVVSSSSSGYGEGCPDGEGRFLFARSSAVCRLWNGL